MGSGASSSVGFIGAQPPQKSHTPVQKRRNFGSLHTIISQTDTNAMKLNLETDGGSSLSSLGGLQPVQLNLNSFFRQV